MGWTALHPNSHPRGTASTLVTTNGDREADPSRHGVERAQPWTLTRSLLPATCARGRSSPGIKSSAGKSKGSGPPDMLTAVWHRTSVERSGDIPCQLHSDCLGEATTSERDDHNGFRHRHGATRLRNPATAALGGTFWPLSAESGG